jgi:ABC-type multidrug transport system ATPase subunit
VSLEDPGPASAVESAGPPFPDPLPQESASPTAVIPMAIRSLRIGRAPDNDLVLDDRLVSRYHAELRKRKDGGLEIADLASQNGTFVNGRRIATQPLSGSDTIGIGHSTFRVSGSGLEQFADDGAVTVAAQELVVTVAGGKILLDGVSFTTPEKCLVGVIGPSGAGKSTLLGAMTGMRPADAGTVMYDNRNLYEDYAELRHLIGLVPQENILYTQLTARRALQYSAELRFPTGTTAAQRDARVTEVLEELGLDKHAQTRADRLSGGQLKRMNVAQELLTRPSLLFLDEPTSGLDPGLDKSIMSQLRDLAHGGRTVIVVTHSVLNLMMCDRLLVLAPGGRMAFYGPPGEALGYFELPDWADLFQAFDLYPDRDWAGEFAASVVHARYAATERPYAGQSEEEQLALSEPTQRRRGLRQYATLTRRYARVIAADRGYVLFMGLLPVVLGLLIRFVPAMQGLAGPNGNMSAQELLQILVTCACLAGTASSVRELVKERPIYIRERAAGLSSGAYLLSKLTLLGAVSVVQSCVIVLLGVAGREMPAHGALLKSYPLLELTIAIAVLAVTSMCLGLLVSAFVSTSEKAMPFLVMLTMFQVILSGGVLPFNGMTGLSQLSWIAPARWGFAAGASTVNLNAIGLLPGTDADPLWTTSSADWLRDVGITAGLGLLYLLVTWIQLRRLGPRRRHAKPARAR